MNIDELTVGQIKEIQSAFGKKKVTKSKKYCGLKIVVLQRGWVLIGEYYKTGCMIELLKPQVIRIWGTSNGLGELAMSGPTSSTKLDPTNTVTFHELTEVLSMEVERKVWANHYPQA
jgi:hypothetical protein